MNCTDADLKGLKEMVNGPTRAGDLEFIVLILPYLLARLEAAEEVIKEFKLEPVPVGVVERWRKAAGK